MQQTSKESKQIEGNNDEDIALMCSHNTKRPGSSNGKLKVKTIGRTENEMQFCIDRKSTRLNSSH